MSGEDLPVGMFCLECPLCGVPIEFPVTMSPQVRHHPTSMSLSSRVDVTRYEEHMESHEGEEVFDD